MPRGSRIKVVVVSADVHYCSLLKAVLDNAPGFHPVTVHSTPAASRAGWGEEPPDVVLLDISVSQLAGLKFVRELKADYPGIAVLVLTDVADEAFIFGFWEAGASGHLLKNTPLARICESIEEVRAGGCPMSPQVARRMVDWFRTHAPAAQPTLSSRESEILEQLARGAQNKEIATELGLSEATVRAHLRRIYEKPHVRSRAEAVARLRPGSKS